MNMQNLMSSPIVIDTKLAESAIFASEDGITLSDATLPDNQAASHQRA